MNVYAFSCLAGLGGMQSFITSDMRTQRILHIMLKVYSLAQNGYYEGFLFLRSIRRENMSLRVNQLLAVPMVRGRPKASRQRQGRRAGIATLRGGSSCVVE